MISPRRAATSCKIGERLLENAVEWRNDDHRHLLVNESYGPVLELARCIACSVDGDAHKYYFLAHK
jgi:hypothetical protein